MRQGDHHRDAAAGRVFDDKHASHRVDEPARERQAEPDAGAVVDEPLKGFEYLFTTRERNALAAIDDPDIDSTRHRTRLDADGSFRGRRGERVVDEVRDRTLQERRIGMDGRQRFRHIDGDARGPFSEIDDRGGDDFVDEHRSCRDTERAGLQAAHVEQLSDERIEAVGGLLDRRLELIALLRRPVDVVLSKAADRRLDRGQGRPQIVRHGLE